MVRYIALPESGFNAQGHKPENIAVTEVPVAVPDEDLKALVDLLCQGTGLALGLPEGPMARPAFSRNYRQLVQLAVARDIAIPVSMAADAAKMRPAGSLKPGRGGIIDLD